MASNGFPIVNFFVIRRYLEIRPPLHFSFTWYYSHIDKIAGYSFLARITHLTFNVHYSKHSRTGIFITMSTRNNSLLLTSY